MIEIYCNACGTAVDAEKAIGRHFLVCGKRCHVAMNWLQAGVLVRATEIRPCKTFTEEEDGWCGLCGQSASAHVAAAAPRAQVVDLMEALKASLAKAKR